MNQVIKIYLGIILILFMTGVGGVILSLFISVIHTQNLFDMFVEQIGYYEFDADIMEKCMIEAKENDVSMGLTLYHEDGSIEYCDCIERIPMDTKDIELVKVEAKFPYQIGEWKMNKNMNLVGYAR